MKKTLVLLVLISFTIGIVPSEASETRKLTLNPIADVYGLEGDHSDKGRELSLFARYETIDTYPGWDFTVGPLNTQTYSYYLWKGSILSGFFRVTQGGNKDISFSIKDDNQTYVGEEKVSQYTFSFTPPKTGQYYLEFDNEFSWFAPKTIALGDIQLASYGIVGSSIILKFDLSDIPPESTILSAKLKLHADSLGHQPSHVDAYYCPENDWNESETTFSAQLQTVSSSPTWTTYVTRYPAWYEWAVTPDVVRALPSGKLTEMLAVTTGEFVSFSSRESSLKPELEISYDYASVSSAVSPKTIVEGGNIGIVASTDPQQSKGNIHIQYSTDQIKWTTVQTLAGGSADFVWQPSITGPVFVRSVWSVSWGEDSDYWSVSGIESVYVKKLCDLELLVKDFLSLPAQGAEVSLTEDGKSVSSGMTDVDGRVIFNDIPEGNYLASVFYMGQTVRTPVSLNSNKYQPIGITLSAYGLLIIAAIIVVACIPAIMLFVRRRRQLRPNERTRDIT